MEADASHIRSTVCECVIHLRALQTAPKINTSSMQHCTGFPSSQRYHGNKKIHQEIYNLIESF